MHKLYTIIVLILLIPTEIDAKRFYVNSLNSLMNSIQLPNSKLVIREPIDLQGKTISVSSNSSLNFKKNGKISNGTIILDDNVVIASAIFENLMIIPKGNMVIKNTTFNNPKKTLCIYRPFDQNNIYSSLIIRNCLFENVGAEKSNQLNTISAIYLQQVCNVTITKSRFVNIGNPTSKNVSSILIGTSSGIYQMERLKPNDNIIIENNYFSGLYSEFSGVPENGERHFVFLVACTDVVINNNYFENINSDHSCDYEFIYTKSDNVTIVNNTMKGVCGGEGFICCKSYVLNADVSMPKVDIINNHIEGSGFSLISHYGTGRITNNTLINEYTGFILSVKKINYLSDPSHLNCYDRVIFNHNRVKSMVTTSKVDYLSSTQRSAIHLDTASESFWYTSLEICDNSFDIDNNYFSSFINLRDFRYSKCEIINNVVNYIGKKDKYFLMFQNVNNSITARLDAKCVIKGNVFNGYEKIVLIPNNNYRIDELLIDNEDNDCSLKGTIIEDKRLRKE